MWHHSGEMDHISTGTSLTSLTERSSFGLCTNIIQVQSPLTECLSHTPSLQQLCCFHLLVAEVLSVNEVFAITRVSVFQVHLFFLFLMNCS